MLAAVIVHLDRREVFTLYFKPIICQDGSTKNDCERNSAKRLVKTMGKHYTDTRLVLVEDALYANAPHIRQITGQDWHYILNVKRDSHRSLFTQVEGRRQRRQMLHARYWIKTAPVTTLSIPIM